MSETITTTSPPRTETISTFRLAEILAAIKCATPISFTAVTDARAKVTGNTYGQIRKVVHCGNAMTGAEYESSVNRQRAREGQSDAGEFKAGTTWGIRDHAALVKGKDGKLYLPVHLRRTRPPIYLYQANEGYWSPIDKARIATLLPPDQSGQAALHQGVEEPVIYRRYSLDHIAAITLNKVRYRVRHERRPVTADSP